MRIEKLHIYGYGKLENVEMDLSMLTVLYGENEAGKSTIRSFMKVFYSVFRREDSAVMSRKKAASMAVR